MQKAVYVRTSKRGHKNLPVSPCRIGEGQATTVRHLRHSPYSASGAQPFHPGQCLSIFKRTLPTPGQGEMLSSPAGWKAETAICTSQRLTPGRHHQCSCSGCCCPTLHLRAVAGKHHQPLLLPSTAPTPEPAVPVGWPAAPGRCAPPPPPPPPQCRTHPAGRHTGKVSAVMASST